VVNDTFAGSVAPADGKLGVLLVGLGAVATTYVAGVENVRRGTGNPVGSLAELATIRLGKRTEGRSPRLREFVPLANLDDIVFGAWDPIPDDAYESAKVAGVLDAVHVDPIESVLRRLKPMPAVFDQAYVKRLSGTNVKQGKTKRDLAEQLREDIRAFKEHGKCDRLVMIWCASTEVFIRRGPVHESVSAFETAMDDNDPAIAPSMLYAWAAIMEGVPFANGAPNLCVDTPALQALADDRGVPIAGKDFKTGQTMVKTVVSPMLKARMLGLSGWYSTNILGNRDGEVRLVLDEHPGQSGRRGPGRSGVVQDEGGVETRGARTHPATGHVSRVVRQHLSQGPDQLLPAPRRQQRRLGQHRLLWLARVSDADQDRLLVSGLDTRRAAGA
jgi:myo-inositol-1-phosphate synthase